MDTAESTIRIWALFRYYCPNFSGAAIQGRRVLSRLTNQGFSVVILAAADHAASRLAGQELEQDGLVIRYLPVVRRRDWSIFARIQLVWKLMTSLNALISGLTLSLRSAWVLWREGGRGDIVQLYSCNVFSFLVVWLTRARGMHPVIRLSLVRSDDEVSFQGKGPGILRMLSLEAFRKAEAVISISRALTNSCHCSRTDPDKIVLIANGVDLDVFHPLSTPERAKLREALGLQPEQHYIVFVGSAKRRKGIDVLIRAFVRVAQQISDVELLIIGPSELGDRARHSTARRQLVAELKQELDHSGFSSRVHWIGRVDNVHEYLQAADIFCFPTRREGLPTAVIEAMAVGLPVVAARLEGVTTDLIRSEEEGILIDGYDPNDYADALLRLLNDSTTARVMGHCARVRAETEFSLELAVQRYAELYRELAGVTHA